MQQIVVVKSIKKGLSNRLLKDGQNIFMGSHWILLLSFLFAIGVFEVIFKGHLFLRLPDFFQAIFCSLFAFWFIHFGYSLSREYHVMVQKPGLSLVLGDTVLNMISYPFLKPLKFFLGLLGAALTPMLLDYVPLLKLYSGGLVPTKALLGMMVFIIISGLLDVKNQDIFMNWDGLVKVKEKDGTYKSRKKTATVVDNYSKINKELNGGVYFFVNIIFVLFLTIFVNHLIAPISLILMGIVMNRVYTYSYYKVDANTGYNGPWVISAKEENAEPEDSDNDAEMEGSSSGEPVSKKINTNLSKEKILGEDWYLNDKKSVIEPDPEPSEEDAEDESEEVTK